MNFEATEVLPAVDFDDPDSQEVPALETPQRADESQAQVLSVNSRHAAALRGAQERGSELQDELAAARQQAAARMLALEQSLRDLHEAQAASAAEMVVAAGRVKELSAALAASESLVTQLHERNDKALHDGATDAAGGAGSRYQQRS